MLRTDIAKDGMNLFQAYLHIYPAHKPQPTNYTPLMIRCCVFQERNILFTDDLFN